MKKNSIALLIFFIGNLLLSLMTYGQTKNEIPENEFQKTKQEALEAQLRRQLIIQRSMQKEYQEALKRQKFEIQQSMNREYQETLKRQQFEIQQILKKDHPGFYHTLENLREEQGEKHQKVCRELAEQYEQMMQLRKENPELFKKLHPDLPYLKAEIVWAVRHEMARTLTDVLSRRTRASILNAKASLEMAPTVLKLMTGELKKTIEWEQDQLNQYQTIIQNYLPQD